jgi:hypothetical protein
VEYEYLKRYEVRGIAEGIPSSRITSVLPGQDPLSSQNTVMKRNPEYKLRLIGQNVSIV